MAADPDVRADVRADSQPHSRPDSAYPEPDLLPDLAHSHPPAVHLDPHCRAHHGPGQPLRTVPDDPGAGARLRTPYHHGQAVCLPLLLQRCAASLARRVCQMMTLRDVQASTIGIAPLMALWASRRTRGVPPTRCPTASHSPGASAARSGIAPTLPPARVVRSPLPPAKVVRSVLLRALAQLLPPRLPRPLLWLLQAPPLLWLPPALPPALPRHKYLNAHLAHLQSTTNIAPWHTQGAVRAGAFSKCTIQHHKTKPCFRQTLSSSRKPRGASD